MDAPLEENTQGKDILIKAIKKAMGNGFDIEEGGRLLEDIEIHYPMREDGCFIFDHDFAKAFWGEGIWSGDSLQPSATRGWQYHLQQMVLEENPLEYLERFL